MGEGGSTQVVGERVLPELWGEGSSSKVVGGGMFFLSWEGGSSRLLG